MGEMELQGNPTETRHPEGLDKEERGFSLNGRVMLKLRLLERPWVPRYS
jgi:hypothetical protein